jgi:hypothetical protein
MYNFSINSFLESKNVSEGNKSNLLLMIKNLPERKQYSAYERKIINKKVCSKISNVE